MEQHHRSIELIRQHIDNKQQYSFIAFDVVDFYTSISIDLLRDALQFASNYDNITSDEE